MVCLLDFFNLSLVGTSLLLIWGWFFVSMAVVKLLQLASGPKATQSYSGLARPAAMVLRLIYLGRSICTPKKPKTNTAS